MSKPKDAKDERKVYLDFLKLLELFRKTASSFILNFAKILVKDNPDQKPVDALKLMEKGLNKELDGLLNANDKISKKDLGSDEAHSLDEPKRPKL